MPTLYLVLIVHLQSRALSIAHVAHSRLNDRDEGGQATTEYALVLLAAALVGLLVVAWATAGGGAARVSSLFNKVIDSAINNV